jgi:3-oxoacyl-[acyl-carrier protein] reductase
MSIAAGRIALITGASQGIGRACALELGRSGASVALAARNLDKLAGVAAEITAAGGTAHPFALDVSSEDSVKDCAKAVLAHFGGVNILVNNAGITRDALALRMRDADWQAVIDLNLTAAFRLTRAALRGMLRRRHGRIVCITSGVGVLGNPGQANYAAAKAGMIGMAKSVAAEVAGRGITVNCVAPGFIATAMTEALSEDQTARATAAVPIGRFGDADEVAAAVVYLASAEAGYVTGHTLHVNGGLAMI